jgi:AraC-like DNA-binding protein
MKPALRSITVNPQASFNVRKDVGANVYSLWHHHPEAELLIIRGGRGFQTIGDRTDSLNENSHMSLIGPYLPHIMNYDSKPDEQVVEAIVVHFKPEIFSKEFLELPEIHPLQELFNKMAYGLHITGHTLTELEPIMFQLYEADYFDRLFLLLDILHLIARRKKDCEQIAGAGFVGNYSPEKNKRLDKVYQYTFDNFKHDVNLDDLTALVGLSKEAFCRYFKQQTGKTYIEFLTEVRIGNACKMLMQNELDVMEISYACGYNYASNFYRQFKGIKGVTPLQYRKSYLNMTNS